MTTRHPSLRSARAKAARAAERTAAAAVFHSSPRRDAAGDDAGEPPRSQVTLAGTWQRYVSDRLLDQVAVPASLRPLGNYHLRRTILLPRLSEGRRAFLHFDAIAYF